MKNQLDLQESEWEAYEETFNTIAEQLDDARGEVEAVTAERDALLAQQSEWKDAAAAAAAAAAATAAADVTTEPELLALQQVCLYALYVLTRLIL
jgi:hypothetical protein